MIRVGRRKYEYGRYKDPEYPNFIPIIVMTASTKYGSLSPFSLKNKEGQIMENIWQFSKVYSHIPASKQTYSRYDPKIIWDWTNEVHIKDGCLTEQYLQWRTAGMNAKYAIRYPVGYHHKSYCLFSLASFSLDDYKIEDSRNAKIPIDNLKQLDYVEARKVIYVPEYCTLVKQQKQYKELMQMLSSGINLLIIEVDGPHEEALSYYKKSYNVVDDFIQRDTMLATEDNLRIMLNDRRYPFGHGYCLAAALLGLDEKII